MDDPWSRSPGDQPTDGPTAFEIPLSGADAEPGQHAEVDAAPSSRTSWRRIGVGALVVGVGAAIGAISLSLGTDDDPNTAAPVQPDATGITTPSTLGPLDTLPSPDDPQLGGAVAEGPEPASSGDQALFDGVMRPVYPTVADVELAELVKYDIAGAVERLADDVPRRSTTHLELGTAGFVIDVTIERDPEHDRYRVTLESGDDVQTAVVDVATATTYIRQTDGTAIDVLNADIIAGSTAADVNEYFDRLLLGPLRPDTFVAPATRGREAVAIDGGRTARQFISNIRGDVIPEWQLYAFSPVFEFPVEDRPSELEYAVYVTEDGRIAQIDGLSLVGDVPQLVLHRLEHPTEPIVIDLPTATTSATPTSSPPTTLATGSTVPPEVVTESTPPSSAAPGTTAGA